MESQTKQPKNNPTPDKILVFIIGKTKRIFLQKRSGSKLAKTKRTCFNVIKTKICTENSEDLTIKQQGAKTRF